MRRKYLWITFLAIIIVAITLIMLVPTFLSPTVSPAVTPEGVETSVLTQPSGTGSIPWYVGVIFFVGIAVGVTLLKNRLAKETKQPYTSSSCVPLVEEDIHSLQKLNDIDQKKQKQ